MTVTLLIFKCRTLSGLLGYIIYHNITSQILLLFILLLEMVSIIVVCLLLASCIPSLAFQNSNVARLTFQRLKLEPLSSPANFQVHKSFVSNTNLKAVEVSDKSEVTSSPLRNSILFLWAIFAVYAFTLAPPDADSATTLALIQKTVSEPFGGEVNPIYSMVFNLLGIYPAMYASLLLPGAGGNKQNIPAQPFVFGSFALGFFALGPYLALRNLNKSGSQGDAGFGNGLFESKLSSILLSVGTLFLVYSGLTTEMANGADKWSDFVQIFSTQRLVHVSTIDFTILTLTVKAINFSSCLIICIHIANIYHNFLFLISFLL